MGNCQAVDAAALVIQHPCGKLERMYWPLTASDVMKTNPGHYVSLIIPLTTPPLPLSDDAPRPRPDHHDNRTVRFTRVKLLRPTDKLVLGRAYRLVTTQEVIKVLRAKKHAKMKRDMSESGLLQMTSQKQTTTTTTTSDSAENDDQAITRSERHRQRSGSTSKSWRPSLQSISEAAGVS